MAVEEAPVQAPTDIAGVGIHLSYIRRDMKNITDKLDAIGSNFVQVGAFIDLKSEVLEHEKKIEVLMKYHDTFTGRLWGICATMTVVISFVTYIINIITK